MADHPYRGKVAGSKRGKATIFHISLDDATQSEVNWWAAYRGRSFAGEVRALVAEGLRSREKEKEERMERRRAGVEVVDGEYEVPPVGGGADLGWGAKPPRPQWRA